MSTRTRRPKRANEAPRKPTPSEAVAVLPVPRSPSMMRRASIAAALSAGVLSLTACGPAEGADVATPMRDSAGDDVSPMPDVLTPMPIDGAPMVDAGQDDARPPMPPFDAQPMVDVSPMPRFDAQPMVDVPGPMPPPMPGEEDAGRPDAIAPMPAPIDGF